MRGIRGRISISEGIRRKTAANLMIRLQLFVVLSEAYGFFYPIAFTPWEVDSLGIVGNPDS